MINSGNHYYFYLLGSEIFQLRQPSGIGRFPKSSQPYIARIVLKSRTNLRCRPDVDYVDSIQPKGKSSLAWRACICVLRNKKSQGIPLSSCYTRRVLIVCPASRCSSLAAAPSTPCIALAFILLNRSAHC